MTLFPYFSLNALFSLSGFHSGNHITFRCHISLGLRRAWHPTSVFCLGNLTTAEPDRLQRVKYEWAPPQSNKPVFPWVLRAEPRSGVVGTLICQKHRWQVITWIWYRHQKGAHLIGLSPPTPWGLMPSPDRWCQNWVRLKDTPAGSQDCLM